MKDLIKVRERERPHWFPRFDQGRLSQEIMDENCFECRTLASAHLSVVSCLLGVISQLGWKVNWFEINYHTLFANDYINLHNTGQEQFKICVVFIFHYQLCTVLTRGSSSLEKKGDEDGKTLSADTFRSHVFSLSAKANVRRWHVKKE